jgi:hypothetical protein
VCRELIRTDVKRPFVYKGYLVWYYRVMEYVIYCESASHSKWIILKVATDGGDYVNRESRVYYVRFAECHSYADAQSIVRAMSVVSINQ